MMTLSSYLCIENGHSASQEPSTETAANQDIPAASSKSSTKSERQATGYRDVPLQLRKRGRKKKVYAEYFEMQGY